MPEIELLEDIIVTLAPMRPHQPWAAQIDTELRHWELGFTQDEAIAAIIQGHALQLTERLREKRALPISPMGRALRIMELYLRVQKLPEGLLRRRVIQDYRACLIAEEINALKGTVTEIQVTSLESILARFP